MPKLVLIIISAIITIIAIFISIVYCCNKKFRSFPFYFNIMFTFSIALNNIIRLLPVSNIANQQNQDTSKIIICHIQAFSLTFLDKYMLTLMTVYSLVTYIGFFTVESFKIYQKSLFIILTIISIIISGVCTIIFYQPDIDNNVENNDTEYCYVKIDYIIKIWVDSIVTSILFLINLFCITRILMKIHIIRKEINKNIIDGKENGFDDHWLRFIIDLIINIIVFIYVLLLINCKLPISWTKDLIYIILCLVVELFFTLNGALIRYLKCQKEDDNMMISQAQNTVNETVNETINDDDDNFNEETES